VVFRTEPNWNRRSKLKIPRTFRRQLVRPRGQRAAHHPASARVRLQAGQGCRFRRAHEVKLDEYSQARQQLPQVGRLHHLSEGNQCPVDGRGLESPQRLLEQQACRLHHLNEGNHCPVDGHDPESRQRLLDQQACRLRHLNAARVDQAGDLRSQARQPTRLEHPA
jgi:hypothetical protein